MVHSLTDWLTNYLTIWLTGRLIDWLTIWLTGWLIDWPTNQRTDWRTNEQTDELTDRLTDILNVCDDWLTNWPLDRLTDRVTNSLTDILTNIKAIEETLVICEESTGVKYNWHHRPQLDSIMKLPKTRAAFAPPSEKPAIRFTSPVRDIQFQWSDRNPHTL